MKHAKFIVLLTILLVMAVSLFSLSSERGQVESGVSLSSQNVSAEATIGNQSAVNVDVQLSTWYSRSSVEMDRITFGTNSPPVESHGGTSYYEMQSQSQFQIRDDSIRCVREA